MWRSDQPGVVVEADLCLGCLSSDGLGLCFAGWNLGCLCCSGVGWVGLSYLGFGWVELGCLDFGWLPWRMSDHCGLQAWT